MRWRSAAMVEVTALTALVLSYIWSWQGAFPGHGLLVVVLYFGIGIVSHVRRGESARQIGFRLDNWPAAFRKALVVVGIASVAFLAVGAALDTWHFPSVRHTVSALPWMLAWATAQQYGLVCFLYQRLLEILQGPRAATLGAAALFAAFHVPNPLLLIVTLGAGIVSCTLYRREPNVLVLGMAHAAVSFVLAGALPLDITRGMHVGPGYFTFA
ncbi:MAG TPA: CPBP family glutamic-type intramembrane protease [Steroidobacteraceae bacterium]|nr:CPBP family glutamic-type intramembrane protease [Steroidobacteraceae bacterium]